MKIIIFFYLVCFYFFIREIRKEIVLVDGFNFGNTIFFFAFDQSIKSVESFFCQNFASSFSFLNFGIFLIFFIYFHLFFCITKFRIKQKTKHENICGLRKGWLLSLPGRRPGTLSQKYRKHFEKNK